VAPLTHNGKKLPVEAVNAFGDMLAFSEPDLLYAGIDQVITLCTPASLEALAIDAFRAWCRVGTDSS
jgi:hypothetical protein